MLKSIKITSVSLLFVLLVSCSDDNGIGGINLFSLNDDVQLGQQLDQEIISNPQEYPIYEDANANAYISGILDQVLQSDDIRYADDFNYQIRIIDQEVLNAFAAPGGYIYIYTGLLKFLDNEASVAAVIAHEAAHCERRHATNRMTKHYGVSVLLGVVLGNNPNVYAEIAANLFTNLAFLHNSREDEYDSDEYSFTYLQDTQWWPGATIFFFDKIKQAQGGGSGTVLEELLSTHPMPQDRIDAVEQMIKESNIGEASQSNLFTDRYLQFKSTLN